jgi:CPA1 family monovalent cation:H+ antiporter
MSSLSTVQLVAAIVALTAAIAWLNARFIRLPPAIAMMAAALVLSITVIGLDAAGAIDAAAWDRTVAQANLSRTLIEGLLGLLLFAGALHIDLGELRAQRASVALLAIGATFASMALVAGGLALALVPLGSPLPSTAILLFAALISPTDPVAVLAALKSSRMPRTIAVQLGAESLFNDGVGVVLFVIVGGVAADSGAGAASVLHVIVLFLREVAGGAALGFALGWLGRGALAKLRDVPTEILVSLGLVLGGYALGTAIGISAPIAAVVAGIVIGADPRARARIAQFWQVVDDLLNAIVFVMLGLEATRVSLTWELIAITAIGIPVVLAARLTSVAAAFAALRPLKYRPPPHAIRLLTWGGLRGALSVAMALAIKDETVRSQILAMTYGVVAFSILVQGVTLPRLLRRLETSSTADHG